MAMFQISHAYKVMVLFPMPGVSHSILGENVARHLLNAGHEVTFITPFLSKHLHPNLTQIDVSGNLNMVSRNLNLYNIQSILNKTSDIGSPLIMFNFMTELAFQTLVNPNVANLFHDTRQTFDVVIAEWMFSDIYAGIPTLYECPFIWLSSLDPHWMALSLVDEAINPAYAADISSSAVPPFSFMERVKGLFSQTLIRILKTLYLNRRYERDFEAIFKPYLTQRGRAMPLFYDVLYNAFLVLSNSHVSIGQALRLPQNYIPVGGYHINEDIQPLPDDLKQLLDNAKNGLIYFSMGTNLKSRDLPNNIKQGLLNIFGKLKQTVLWKFEEKLSNLPSNVHIVHWAPQQSILAHPNCILFITHGGLLSTTEAIYFGRPMVGIPIFGDQFVNIDRAVKKGYAKRVDLSYSMVNDLENAIRDVLIESKYKNKAKALSLIYHDRPVSPGEELVHWVEHVIRTRGAPHLRSPALHVPVYQKYYLDLIALIIAIVITIKVLIKCLFCPKNRTIKKKLFILHLITLSVEGYKILVAYPLPVRSLNILGEGYVRRLLNAGHEVTYITGFPLDNEDKNKLRQINIKSNFDAFPDGGAFDISTVIDKGMEVNADPQAMQDFALYNAFMTFENKDVKALIEDPKQEFDLVIADLYETEIYAGFSALYNCPMIWSYSMGAHWQVLRLIDEATNPAYTSDYLSANIPPFDFGQRVQELWLQLQWKWIKWYSTTPKEELAYKQYFGPPIEQRGRKLPDYQELIYNASMILSNDYNAFGNIPRTPQNFKLIGGYHIATHTQPLPKDLQSLMDNATNGVIYFSMGSTLKSKDIPKPIVEHLLKIFKGLEQTIIWKFEEQLSNLPKNVHITSWAPQPSILAHSNCLFFISHGGQLSSSESIHFGIPVIGIPIYMDQFVNIEKAVSRGYAIRVPFTHNLANDLESAIEMMLNEPQYRQRAKELSAIYHDRPVSPGEELVHWVEHVIRTRSAPHLRSPALNVPFYQKYYLDLIALFIMLNIVLYTVMTVIYKVFKGKRKEKVN
ncbi:uncharacterized protein LOC131846569 [Achroia grisella]|uniref:uncharacterized protein LOC131846569 n=1 Tax=Achroia grisella TaxID=688607 RepID=UPI0027D2622F|nr:uncharacterized protein LOC131846569 [Achroia grisella]